MPRDDRERRQRKEAIRETARIYEELAARPVERDCLRRTECCQFKLTGRVPFLTLGEALVAAAAVRASGRKKLPEKEDGSCPMLEAKTGRCLIYEARPFGCRTHFCAAAGGPYARGEVVDLIRRLEAVDANLGGEGARGFSDAVNRLL